MLKTGLPQPSGNFCRSSAWTLGIFLFFFAGNAGHAQESPTLEYQVKAAYIYNFVKFIKWNEDSSATGESQLVIGVIGKDRFGSALDSLEGQKAWDKQIVVRRLQNTNEASDCHVVFVSTNNKRRIHSILEALSAKQILTIGETKGFAKEGGIINFVQVADKIRFEINHAAANAVGLQISSQLLKLAIEVYKENG